MRRDGTLSKTDHPVAEGERRGSMRNDNDRQRRSDLFDGPHYFQLRGFVERAGGFIEHENRPAPVKGPGDAEALSLAA